MKLELDPNNLPKDADWEGNNAAFTCPKCGKVFIVSWLVHHGKRRCPNKKCGKYTGYCDKKGRKEVIKSGGTAPYIEWE